MNDNFTHYDGIVTTYLNDNLYRTILHLRFAVDDTTFNIYDTALTGKTIVEKTSESLCNIIQFTLYAFICI